MKSLQKHEKIEIHENDTIKVKARKINGKQYK